MSVGKPLIIKCAIKLHNTIILLLQFQRGTTFGNSTNREDFQCYSTDSYRPDVSTRRKGLLMNDVC